MPKLVRTVTLKQLPEWGSFDYVVVSITNTTEPRVHMQLMEPDVKHLINVGYKVTIKG